MDTWTPCLIRHVLHRVLKFCQSFPQYTKCMLQINTKKKKTEKVSAKASSAPKEAKKPAAVQKEPEKAQKRNLINSSNSVGGFIMLLHDRIVLSQSVCVCLQFFGRSTCVSFQHFGNSCFHLLTKEWSLVWAWLILLNLTLSILFHLDWCADGHLHMSPRTKSQWTKLEKRLLLRRRPRNPLRYKKARRKRKNPTWSILVLVDTSYQ